MYVVVVVVFFTLTDRASTIYPVIYVVANPARGHKEVPRSTGHIMVTTRYSDQQGSKSPTKSYATLQAMTPTNNKTDQSNKSDEYVSISFDQQFQFSQSHTSYKNKEN